MVGRRRRRPASVQGSLLLTLPTFVHAGFEARGLIFGAPLALALKVPFVPLRKPKKLPGKKERRPRWGRAPPPPLLHHSSTPTQTTNHLFFKHTAGDVIYADYITEYSTDRIEMHSDAVKPGQKVVLIDDLVATGGTLRELVTVLLGYLSILR